MFLDPNYPVYQKVKDRISWGILDRIIGTKKVNVVMRNANSSYSVERPFFVSAFDLI